MSVASTARGTNNKRETPVDEGQWPNTDLPPLELNRVFNGKRERGGRVVRNFGRK
jgi:hypothetical protein